MLHFIWVFTLYQSTSLGVSSIQRDKLQSRFPVETYKKLSFFSCVFKTTQQKLCYILLHFIWVFTVCKSTHLVVSSMQRDKTGIVVFQKFLSRIPSECQIVQIQIRSKLFAKDISKQKFSNQLMGKKIISILLSKIVFTSSIVKKFSTDIR